MTTSDDYSNLFTQAGLLIKSPDTKESYQTKFKTMNQILNDLNKLEASQVQTLIDLVNNVYGSKFNFELPAKRKATFEEIGYQFQLIELNKLRITAQILLGSSGELMNFEESDLLEGFQFNMTSTEKIAYVTKLITALNIVQVELANRGDVYSSQISEIKELIEELGKYKNRLALEQPRTPRSQYATTPTATTKKFDFKISRSETESDVKLQNTSIGERIKEIEELLNNPNADSVKLNQLIDSVVPMVESKGLRDKYPFVAFRSKIYNLLKPDISVRSFKMMYRQAKISPYALDPKVIDRLKNPEFSKAAAEVEKDLEKEYEELADAFEVAKETFLKEEEGGIKKAEIAIFELNHRPHLNPIQKDLLRRLNAIVQIP